MSWMTGRALMWEKPSFLRSFPRHRREVRRRLSSALCRYDNAYLFGAICPARGVGAALVLPYADTDMMQLHLNEISRNVAEGAHAVLLLDRAGWHTTGKLDVPNNITPIFLPSRAPELNPVENIWQYLRQNWLSNTVFENYDAIVDAASAAWRLDDLCELSQLLRRVQIVRRTASCAGVGSTSNERRGLGPSVQLSMRPSRPDPLKRWTQSRSVWRSIPPIFAAEPRSMPSRTAASDKSRRLSLTFFDRRANARSSAAE